MKKTKAKIWNLRIESIRLPPGQDGLFSLSVCTTFDKEAMKSRICVPFDAIPWNGWRTTAREVQRARGQNSPIVI